jgi:Protein of unknown function (DUF1059)
VEKVLRCDCGLEARADDEGELVARVRQRAREAHGMELSSEQALLLAFRAEVIETSTPPTSVREADNGSSEDGNSDTREEK